MTRGKKFPQRLIFKDVLRKRLTARQKIRLNERERERERERECVQYEERDKRKSEKIMFLLERVRQWLNK